VAKNLSNPVGCASLLPRPSIAIIIWVTHTARRIKILNEKCFNFQILSKTLSTLDFDGIP
jgi:hypothetical protein